MYYHTLNEELRRRFGCKVYKLALDGGFTCPNRDGTIGARGCIFCAGDGSGAFAADRALDISQQIEAAKVRVAGKNGGGKYIAYFQNFTNTYGSLARMEQLFTQALAPEDVVALSVATRPDCLPDAVIALLQRLNTDKPVWVELGLQTIHEETARRIHRGYELPVFEDAYRRLKEPFGTASDYEDTRIAALGSADTENAATVPTFPSGLEVIVHVILGLPGETREDMLETVRYLSNLSPTLDGIKLQLLHILKGTELAREYEADPFPLFTLDSYCDLIVDCLRLLPPETVVHRITGDGPKRLLIAPLWSADKKKVLNTLNKKIREATR